MVETPVLKKKEKKELKRKAEDSSNVEPTTNKSKKNKKEDITKEEKKKEKKERKEKKEKKEKSQTPETPLVTQEEEPKTATENLFYKEHDAVKAMTAEVAQKYFEENEISVSGGDRLIKPITDFAHAGFTSDLMQVCKGFSKPTPIQASTWPISLSGTDVIGIAETGSGKTLAFTLPGLMHLKRLSKNAKPNKSNKARTPSILVVSPTRELAMQTEETCSAAGATCGLTSICIYGGVPKDEQRRALRNGVDIVVATPGRLLDLMEEKICDISNVTYMVLDEADRMLDQGFEVAIRKILSETPKTRQTLMFSATWPESIRKLANDFLRDPVRVTIGSDDLTASGNVTQIVEVLDPFGKEKRLMELLKKYHSSRQNRVLIFALYKKEAARLESTLNRQGWKAMAIHGDQSQAQRTQALAGFKDGTHPLLVATDVAARGLDIPNVEYVINFTFPLTIEDYIHRIGRTGRGGRKGTAHTLFTQHDKSHAGELQNVLKNAGFEIPESLKAFGGTVKKKEHKSYGAFFKDVDMSKKATKITFDSDEE